MQITLFSLFMSVIWSGALVVFNHFCRKNPFLIRQLGITNLLCLYLFPVLRMILPCEFSFTRVIYSPEVFDDIYANKNRSSADNGRDGSAYGLGGSGGSSASALCRSISKDAENIFDMQRM